MGSTTNICYGGIGSLENGNHTRKEFLEKKRQQEMEIKQDENSCNGV